jgi:hypothetical protein
MKFSHYLSILFFITLGISGCKKKAAPAVEEETPCNYTSTFNVIQNYSISNNILVLNGRKPDVMILAYCGSSKGPTNVPLESLYFNSTSLKLAYSYWTSANKDTLPQNVYPPYTWKINGTEKYPSFTESVADSFPSFTKYTMMPDSMSKSGSTVIQLGSTNANEVFVYIDNGTSQAPPDMSGIYSCGPASVNSTSMILNYDSNISSSSTCSLTVQYSKKYSKTINDKKVDFALTSVYRKKIKFYN